MYGDRIGSASREDRQDGTDPQRGSWDAGLPPAPADDVKVAGAPIFGQRDLPDDLGATTAMPPPAGVEPEAYGDFEDMRRSPRSSRKLIKTGAVVAAVAVAGGVGAWALTSGSSSPATKNAAAPQMQANVPAPAPLTDAQRKDAADKRRQELKKRASRAARQEMIRPQLFAKGTTPKPSPPPTQAAAPAPASGSAGNPVPAGTAQQIARSLMPSFGWSPSSQFGCIVSLWNRESGWNVHAANPSGAYGIPQALPGSKMASAGPNWQDNATTQIKWGYGYIQSRYSTPCGAWAHSQSTGWY